MAVSNDHHSGIEASEDEPLITPTSQSKNKVLDKIWWFLKCFFGAIWAILKWLMGGIFAFLKWLLGGILAFLKWFFIVKGNWRIPYAYMVHLYLPIVHEVTIAFNAYTYCK